MSKQVTLTRWITYGDVRGFGDVRQSREQADEDLARDCDGCREQGGYSDRSVYSVDDEGYLRDDDGYLVWPSSGRSNGAVRIEAV